MKKGCIIYNQDKSLAHEIYMESLKYFSEKEIEILPIEESGRADFIVIIGGDGTLLRGLKKFVNNANIDVLGVNAGNLGFLTEIKTENFIELYDDYFEGKYKSEVRHILEVKVNGKIYYALNEICVSKYSMTSKVIRTKFVSDNEYMCTYKSDGVIISTPTGSTAYSMSAGGPIVKSNIKAIVITPLAPHNLNTRPIVIDGSEKLEVSLEDKGARGVFIVDGQVSGELSENDKIYIEYTNKRLNLVISESRNYYSVLREKLKWGDNLC
ncbi:NAD(+)/NADH kinase [Fusobacterium sp. PH5-44]|uniref:NAD(+)/NADH kinase n=1 Tax=unclassified Fusobacterium TaxID=2648384 RepID=UPI003D1E658A